MRSCLSSISSLINGIAFDGTDPGSVKTPTIETRSIWYIVYDIWNIDSKLGIENIVERKDLVYCDKWWEGWRTMVYSIFYVVHIHPEGIIRGKLAMIRMLIFLRSPCYTRISSLQTCHRDSVDTSICFSKTNFVFYWLHSMWAGSKRWISSLAPVKGMKDLIGGNARKYNQVV